MIEPQYLTGLNGKEQFSRKELLESFRLGGYSLSDASFYKRIEEFVRQGELVRVGRNVYRIPAGKVTAYEHTYSELAEEIANKMSAQYPYLSYSIFELVQLNDFVNHQIAHNVIYLSVEAEAIDFVFDMLKEYHPGKVLINPSVELYHQYWSDNMIVIEKLTTEAPKGHKVPWHTRLEKMLVDLLSDSLILASVGESEYATIYQDAFTRYIIDEKALFRYANRRKVDKKILKFIKEETDIKLYTRG